MTLIVCICLCVCARARPAPRRMMSWTKVALAAAVALAAVEHASSFAPIGAPGTGRRDPLHARCAASDALCCATVCDTCSRVFLVLTPLGSAASKRDPGHLRASAPLPVRALQLARRKNQPHCRRKSQRGFGSCHGSYIQMERAAQWRCC